MWFRAFISERITPIRRFALINEIKTVATTIVFMRELRSECL